MHRYKGFTLIELLIVVAIIAILAAIAVPNFLEAQTRSKVARVKADLRTMVTALEAYAVDNNKYPADYALTILVRGDGEFGTSEGYFPPTISTPIAYLTTARLTDPFVEKGASGVSFNNPAYSTLFYQNVRTSVDAANGNAVAYRQPWQILAPGAISSQKATQGWNIINPNGEQRYGLYKLGSLGPDRFYLGGANIYDATNGTVSRGDIYRTQKQNNGGF
ncbi:hypothetical protein BH09SUM1_BH09SUM1_13560 [soil metagenome]